MTYQSDYFSFREKVNLKKPLIIAHRGASASAPENTFAAFKKAIDADADGIEFDVRLTKDSIPVVVHDSTLKRLAGIEKRIADLTGEDLKNLDVGSWFNRAFPQKTDENFAREFVPTLAALFDFLRGYRGLIYVELKGKNAAAETFAQSVCNLVRQTALLPNIIIKSFNLEAIKTIKKILPEAQTAALFEPKILTILRKKKMILDEAEKHHADQISIHYSLATKKFVASAREKNLPVTIWTADNPVWVKRALDYQIGAIITNDPARLLKKRDEIL